MATKRWEPTSEVAETWRTVAALSRLLELKRAGPVAAEDRTMTAPTEEEIREERVCRYYDSVAHGPYARVVEKVAEAAYEAQVDLRYYPPDQRGVGYRGDPDLDGPQAITGGTALFAEADDDLKDELVLRIMDRMMGAALQFVREYPDVPLSERDGVLA